MKEITLSSLGSSVLDAYDRSIIEEDFEILDEVCKEVSQEVMNKLGIQNIRFSMDSHYKQWADSVQNGNKEESNQKFYELKALMTAFTELFG